MPPTPSHNRAGLHADPACVTLSEAIVEQWLPLRFLIRDAVIRNWATYIESLAKREGLRPYILTSLEDPQPGRSSLEPIRRTWERHALANRCVLSGVSLTRFDADHLVPWSLYPSDDWFNLVPADPSVNLQKRDALPKIAGSLEDRVAQHFGALEREVPACRGRDVDEELRGLKQRVDGLREITGRRWWVPRTA